MANPKKMIRSDGSRVSISRSSSWKAELKGLWIALHTDPAIVLLFPMFFASNWFYTWRKLILSGSQLSLNLKRDASQNSMTIMLLFLTSVLVR